MILAPKVTSATGRTPHDSKGRKQGPRGRKPASAIARRRLRRCCGDRDEQTLRHGDEDGWPPIQGVWKSNATPPGRRGPERSGCSTEDDGDHRRRLAPLVQRLSGHCSSANLAKSAFGLGTHQGLDDFQRELLVFGRQRPKVPAHLNRITRQVIRMHFRAGRPGRKGAPFSQRIELDDGGLQRGSDGLQDVL